MKYILTRRCTWFDNSPQRPSARLRIFTFMPVKITVSLWSSRAMRIGSSCGAIQLISRHASKSGAAVCRKARATCSLRSRLGKGLPAKSSEIWAKPFSVPSADMSALKCSPPKPPSAPYPLPLLRPRGLPEKPSARRASLSLPEHRRGAWPVANRTTRRAENHPRLQRLRPHQSRHRRRNRHRPPARFLRPPRRRLRASRAERCGRKRRICR